MYLRRMSYQRNLDIDVIYRSAGLAEASFISQTIADIANNNILDYLELGRDRKTSAATTKGGVGGGKPTSLSLSASWAAVYLRTTHVLNHTHFLPDLML